MLMAMREAQRSRSAEMGTFSTALRLRAGLVTRGRARLPDALRVAKVCGGT